MSHISLVTVSIVTPVHNAENFIVATIESVLAQTYSNWEFILVDDASTDFSSEIVTEYVNKDSRIKLLRLSENSGAAVARNTAIEAANGRYIAFLDSDDVWLPEKLERQIAFMKDLDCEFSYTQITRHDMQGQQKSMSNIPDKVDYSTLLKTNVVVCSSAMYDTWQFGKVLMPNIRKRQDFALWLKLLKHCDYGYGLQESLVKYSVRDGSISSNRSSAAHYTWRVYRDIEQLSLFYSLYYFVHYAVNAFIRIKLPSLARIFGLLK